MTALTYTAIRKIHADHIQSELISNGDFSSGATGWTATDWTVTTLATHNTGNTTPLKQSFTGVVGTTYDVSFTVSGRTTGSVTPYLGAQAGTAVTTNGTVSEPIAILSIAELAFVPTTDFDGAIDDVSVIITDTWSKDLTALSNLSENWPIKSDEQVALDGSTETILHRQDQVWIVSENLITYAGLTSDYWYEFLASVYGGETFTFDANGTIAIPDNPVDVILVKGSQSITRNNTNDLFTVSFSVREI